VLSRPRLLLHDTAGGCRQLGFRLTQFWEPSRTKSAGALGVRPPTVPLLRLLLFPTTLFLLPVLYLYW
jgi:hypothetical protein